MELTDILNNSNITIQGKTVLLKILNSLKSIDAVDFRELSKVEDDIYTVNKKVLTDLERIDIELMKINSFLAFNNDDYKNDSVFSKYLSKLNQLTITKESKLENISDIKKFITIIQALLGLDISFFNSAFSLLSSDSILLNDFAVNNNKNKRL